MKKALFLCAFWALFFTVGCSQKKVSNATSGEVNTIAVIIDDQLWNGEVGDSIRNKFASPVVGLPKEEPMFTINQYPIRLLEGYMTHSRNIVVVKRANENRFQVVQNEFASPQNVFHISGKTAASILNTIEAYAPEMIGRMHQTEIAASQAVIDTALADTRKITNKFRIGLHVPKPFKMVMSRKKFLWYKKEITSGNTSLLIYQVPLSAVYNGRDVAENLIEIRDSVGGRYVRGAAPGTSMTTEDSYAPYLTQTTYKGRPALEMRGNWEMRNDFMSGPFLLFAVADRVNNRMLILEGFCYAPSREKRDLMFELEAIVKSVEFLKKKNTVKK